MEFDNPTEVLKKGFHVTLGATTALMESLQDERKREENLSQLNLGFDQVTEIWAEKGAVTETEARSMIDGLVAQYGPTVPQTPPTKSAVPTGNSVDPDLHQELRALTTQLAAIRTELSQVSQDGSEP